MPINKKEVSFLFKSKLRIIIIEGIAEVVNRMEKLSFFLQLHRSVLIKSLGRFRIDLCTVMEGIYSLCQ